MGYQIKGFGCQPQASSAFMLRKALLILSGNAAASLLLLARNLSVARMIPVADYGVAATFAMAMAVIEMASTLGLQQQIVQSKDGDKPQFQAALQGFQLLRGVIAGGVLLAVAHPFAAFFGVPEAAWAYQMLALVPVLSAAQHFDIHRLNRQMRFGPLLLTGVVPAAAALVVVWPLAHFFGDWRVMLWSILAQSVLSTVTSHLVAERRFQLAWDRAIVTSSLRFGWPLLVNSGLMFLVFHGDKVLVGRIMGMESLAIFAMGLTLTLTPTLVLARSAQNLFLPRLSAAIRDKTTAFPDLAHAMLQVSILNGALMVGVIVLFGGSLILAVLGSKYADLLPLLPAFALLNALRVFKAGPNVVALSVGQTSNLMLSNLPRVLALPIAMLLLASDGTLAQLLWLGVTVEAIGYLIALTLLRCRIGLSLRCFLPVGLAATVFIVAATLPWIGVPMAEAIGKPELGRWVRPLAMTVSLLLLLATMNSLRRSPSHRIPEDQ